MLRQIRHLFVTVKAMSRLSAYPIFIAVYEEQRLHKAARRLCVTPSAVSHALRDFEDRLGFRLFERTSEGMMPTALGRMLYEKTRPLIAALDSAERELLAQATTHQTELIFASIHTFIKEFFVPVLQRMPQEQRPATVRLLTCSMKQTVDAVAEGKALVGSCMLPLADPERFYVVPLTSIGEFFVVSEALYEQYQRERNDPDLPWSLQEIVQRPLITLPRDSASFAGYKHYFSQYGLALEPSYEVHQEDLGFDLAARGLGIFIGFDPVLFHHSELRVIRCRSQLPARELVLFCCKEKANEHTKRLMQEMAWHFADVIRDLKRYGCSQAGSGS